MNPGTVPPPLQFDTAVVSGDTTAVPGGSAVTCGRCQQPILTEYYDVNTIAMCEGCRAIVEQQIASPSGVGVLGRALLFGLGAAIAGAILYYAVAAIANLEIGLVAIAIGYMVGYAIRVATGGRGGRRLQVLAVVLTYWSVGLAYTALAIQSQPDSTAGDTLFRTAASQPDTENRTADAPLRTGEFAGGVASLVGFVFVAPVLVVFGSLPGGVISAVIIGVGMQQAWKMTGVPHVVITGPFQVAAPPPPIG